MADEWKIVTLGEVCANSAFGPRFSSDEYSPNGNVACLRTMDVGFDGQVNLDAMPLAQLDLSKLQQHILRRGDLVITRTGAFVGKTAVFEEFRLPVLPGAFLIRFRMNQTLADPWFIHYFFSSPQGQSLIRSVATGSAQPNLNITNLHTLAVGLPPLLEQRAIAEILGELDDRIELNRRMNRTLEATARAIFKSWFLEFDPVRAKAAGKQPPGLKSDVAALFPDAFEDSELGEIPKGWLVTSMQDEATANKGLSYKGQHLCEAGEGLPMHNLNSVYEGGGYKHEGLKWYNGEFRPGHLLEPGDVIVTNTEQGFDHLLIGYAALVPERYGPKGLFSHHIYRLRPKPTSYLRPWFFYLLLRTPQFHDLVAGHSNGTTVNMLPADGLQKPRFVLPPQPLVEKFDAVFSPVQARLDGVVSENKELVAVRDALLPRLISGELRVPDAERIVGRCA